MPKPPEAPLDTLLKAWAQEETRLARVRWTPEYLLLKARLARLEREGKRMSRLERGAWLLGAAAGLLGLCLAWPAHPQGWFSLLETPIPLLAPLFSLGLLGGSLRGLLET